MSFRTALIAGALLFASTAHADQLDALLAKGPVVLVESQPNGRFGSATAIINVDAPLDHVWSTILDFEKYKDFVPKVVKCEITKGKQTVDPYVRWVLATPIFNTIYTIHYHIDNGTKTITGDQVEGALKDSHWQWQVEAAGPTRTLIYYKSQAKNFSSFIEGIEDQQQSITIGVNVGGAVSLLRAIKKRAEQTH